MNRRESSLYADSADPVYNPPMFIKVNTVFSTAITLLSNIVLYSLAIENQIDQSSYFAFTAAYGMVMGAFMSLSEMAMTTAQIQPILEMAEPFLETEPETSEEKQIVTDITGGISLEHVSFRYSEDSPYILDDLSLSIRPGEYVAVVGRDSAARDVFKKMTFWELIVAKSGESAAEKSAGAEPAGMNLPFKVASEVKDGTLEMSVQGRMDTITAPEVLKQFQDAGSNIEAIHINVSRMAYISSAGLRVLVMMIKSLENADDFKMTGASEEVRTILKTSGLDWLLLR